MVVVVEEEGWMMVSAEAMKTLTAVLMTLWECGRRSTYCNPRERVTLVTMLTLVLTAVVRLVMVVALTAAVVMVAMPDGTVTAMTCRLF